MCSNTESLNTFFQRERPGVREGFHHQKEALKCTSPLNPPD